MVVAELRCDVVFKARAAKGMPAGKSRDMVDLECLEADDAIKRLSVLYSPCFRSPRGRDASILASFYSLKQFWELEGIFVWVIRNQHLHAGSFVGARLDG